MHAGGCDGFPPRVRGKPDIALGRRIRNRITPAYAGSAKGSLMNFSGAQDHPRVCGEELASSVLSIVISGITPAYAGKTSESLFV